MIASKLNPAWYARETLQGAFPIFVPKERRFLALFDGYFDDSYSGTDDPSDCAVIAGFVSEPDQWIAFSEKWQQVLTREHLDYFRMSDFENRQGQFKNWSNERRHSVLNEVLTIINTHTFYSLGCMVPKEYVASLSIPGIIEDVYGGAFGVAALVCWRNLGPDFKQLNGWLNCVFEDGMKGQGTFQELYKEQKKFRQWREEHRVISLSFMPKRSSLPLQAADILAYELYKQSTRMFGQETRDERYPLKVLRQSGNQGRWVYMTEELLREAHNDIVRQYMNPS